jgi:hypothetical protein
MAYPEMITAIAHLRDVLGDQTYESLARKGETMTTDEMVTYAYAQIEKAPEQNWTRSRNRRVTRVSKVCRDCCVEQGFV